MYCTICVCVACVAMVKNLNQRMAFLHLHTAKYNGTEEGTC